jgi:AcrR family transcriptional regulator
MNEARAYDSPLRAEQLEQTRGRILEAAVDLLADDGLQDLTIPLVADRARVSVRTVYRHFPTKEALLDAIVGLIDSVFGVSPFPARPDELPSLGPRLFARFDEVEGIVRAVSASEAGRSVTRQTRSKRIESLRRTLAPLLKGRTPEERRRIVAAVYAIHSTRTWQLLRDYFGFDGEEAGEAVAWLMEAALERLEREAQS